MAAEHLDENTPLLGARKVLPAQMDDSVVVEPLGKDVHGHTQSSEVYWESRNVPGSLRLDESDFVTITEDRDLKRGLQQRHISLIAIAGAIGTGLFLGLGGSIQTGGPLGALLGYATVGLIVCAVQFALGEVTALLPVTGSFVRHAELLFDPALGFAVGYNLVYGNCLSIPTEITAICVLFQYWTDINSSLWIVMFIALTVAIGLCFIGIYGEVEFWFALLKIVFIVFLILLGLIIDLGGVSGTPRIGFRYWKNPGPFVEFIASGSWGKFLGYWAVMSNAVFSFAGVESLAMAAAETKNPRVAIPKACKRVFFRVAIFYILAVLIVGMLVSSDDTRLDDAYGTAAQSPFVIAASAAGLRGVPSLVNAVVITSAWSSSNQALLSGTRVLYSLALKNQAPKIFLRTTSWGTPYLCTLFFAAFMFLSFMSLSSGALTVFWWLVDLTACGVLISWITVLANHLRLMRAMKAQGIELKRLPWHSRWTEYSTPAALVLCVVIILTAGFPVFTKGNWSASSFVSSYLDIPLVIVAYLAWKLYKRTQIVKLADIPLEEALARAEQDIEPEPNLPLWRKITFHRRTQDLKIRLRANEHQDVPKSKYCYVTDRKKELIKVRGFHVSPAELEGVILTHPAVADAAVIGGKSPTDPNEEELPRAFVVRRRGGEAEGKSEVDQDEIVAFCGQRLVKYKALTGGVCFVDAIPWNAAGKALKRLLRQDVKAQGRHGSREVRL